MKRRQEDMGQGKPLVVVLATLFVIGGVAIAAYVSQQTHERPFEPAKLTEVATTSTISTVPELLLRNASAVTWVHPNGLFERLTYSGFAARFADVSHWPTFGVDAALGREQVFSASEGDIATGAFSSPDRVFLAKMLPPKADGASVVELTREKEAPRQVVLRQNNRPLTEAQVFGWFDARTMAMSAMGTSTRDIFAVNTDGQATRLGSFPENAFQTLMSQGMFFVTTAQPGQGIELPPTGPSEVYAYSAQGALGSIFQSDSVVASFVHDPFTQVPSDRFAYMTDDGQVWLMDQGKRHELGKVRPLLFLPNGRFVYRQGFDLMVRDGATGETSRIGALPEGMVSVYPFSSP